jgi:hypothetical protein
MKFLRKISIGGINGIRGGFKEVKGRVLVMIIGGITTSYKEKVSETMGTSYAFNGEFRAINSHGEECGASVAYMPEPAQGMLKAQLDGLGEAAGSVEFGFKFYAVEDETAIKGYSFECVSMQEARPSTALSALIARLGMEISGNGDKEQAQIGNDAAEPAPGSNHAASAPHDTGKGKGKGK